MMGLPLFVILLVVNLACWHWAPATATAIWNSDPVVVAAAVYGISHIEWLMLRATYAIIAHANAIISTK